MDIRARAGIAVAATVLTVGGGLLLWSSGDSSSTTADAGPRASSTTAESSTTTEATTTSVADTTTTTAAPAAPAAAPAPRPSPPAPPPDPTTTTAPPSSPSGEQSSPGTYEEWTDNQFSFSWPDGDAASSMQAGRDYERLRFSVSAQCDTGGSCTARFHLENTAGKTITFTDGLKVDLFVMPCGDPPTLRASAHDPARTSMAPGEAFDTLTSFSVDTAGQYCVSARTVIQLT